MKVVLLWIGKTAEQHYTTGVDQFARRIERYHPFEIQEIPSIRKGEKLKPDQLKQKEQEAIEKRLQPGDHIVLLDEHGKENTSTEFADLLQRIMLKSVKRLVFVIGGAYGFSTEFKEKCPQKLSLSKMTFSHQMIRLLFLEQLYRANTILRNEPYHNS